MVATSDAESRYVARLESEVDFLRGQVATKDEQIKELTERSRETNVLIGGLQRLFAPMLGSADPHQASQAVPAARTSNKGSPQCRDLSRPLATG